ncbi:MAG: site-specific DNA-methyltransferase [Gammaproteobacteria bacterium]|nr:MAG: site-specific DNA-methyltransferase [Gammaproteobacteria bacterium]RKZ76862.1 MAG: site-specific DNA-methyltransferase [Gammaproteobacteria bacterium]
MVDISKIVNKVILGDIRTIAASIPDNLIQSIITSPPYFGHRNYTGEEECEYEIGRESSLEDYVANIVSCFSVIKSKLCDDGLLWLNLGDTYRNKELQGVPWRVAFALKESGWILRSDIIWKKPNAMPSSVKNRPTTDHEYIFLFSKSSNYYYDADSIREPHVTFTENSKMRGGRNHLGKRNGTPENGKNSGDQNLHNGRWDQAFHPKGRNKRTVWEIPLGKFMEAHFAVYPEFLVETCLLASTRKGDIVFDPFAGSGTTGVVAIKNERRFIGCDLVKEYQEMAQKRIDEIVAQPSLFSAERNLQSRLTLVKTAQFDAPSKIKN